MGVPYSLPDGARVGINAESGELEGLAVVFRTPPPAPATFEVASDTAGRIAIGQIEKAMIADAQPFRLYAEVVRPNTRWQPTGSEEPLAVLPRVAWVCIFCDPEGCPTVYVDAETGEVIGGERGLRRGRTIVVPIAKRLQAAREIQFFRRAKNGTWPEKPLGVLSEKSNAPVFAALKKAGEHSAGPPKSFPEYKVVLITDKKQRDELAFVGKTGLLGGGAEWIAAPAELRRWIDDAGRAASGK
jgi:hypothetical protein